MRLTVELLQATYDMLCHAEPFSKWNLPSGEDITFKILKTRQWHADHVKRKGRNIIRVSRSNVVGVNGLVKTMAHEMVHLYLTHNRMHGRQHHGLAFQKIAGIVCKSLWIEPSEF